jgi:hypothetical protein
MIRKQARERRDYLYRRALTLRDAELASKRAALKESLASGKPLSKDVANDTTLRQDYKYDESRADRTVEEELGLDDEYAQLSGVVDPRILVTTSRYERMPPLNICICIRHPTNSSFLLQRPLQQTRHLRKGNQITPSHIHPLEPRKHDSAQSSRKRKIRRFKRYRASTRAQRYSDCIDSIAFPTRSYRQLFPS